MRNKFKGNCYICGKEVAEGKGFFERNGKGGWQVRHVHCESQHYLKKCKSCGQERCRCGETIHEPSSGFDIVA
jgi:hypothetical protein